jgi:hypothetical protein
MATESEQYEAFTELAKSYCSVIEDSSLRGMQGLRAIHDLLLPLHAVAMQLPQVKSEVDFNGSVESHDYQKVCKDLQERLPIDPYWDTFDPLKEPAGDVVAGSLSDDLADIWRDLKIGLIELQAKGEASHAEVWWEWRFSFYTHWGAHSADALRVMYYALRDS